MDTNGTYLSTKEAAELLGFSSVTIQRMIARGELAGAFKRNPNRKNSGFMIPRIAIDKILETRDSNN